MIRQYILATAAGTLLLVGSFISLGDGSISQTNFTEVGNIQRIDLHWNSLTNNSTGTIAWLNGELYRVTFVPNGGTNDYGATMTDSTGFDILQGLGSAGITSNAVTTVVPGIGFQGGVTGGTRVVVCSSISVNVTNTGIGTGYISLFYRK